MKKMMRVLCFALVLVMLGSLCACGGGSSTQEESVEDKVRSAVTSQASLEYFGSKIGGNELKSSSATITNLKKISDKEYNVSGKIEMTDVYGTKWNNTFDCTVKLDADGEWEAGSFEYTSKNWSK